MQAGARAVQARSASMQPPKRVLVLGAGWAGISAARTLLAEAPPGALQVTVLEATDQIGGRSRCGVLPNSGPVELGATWFHGTRGNPVYDFAVRHGVVSDPERAAQLGLSDSAAAASDGATGTASVTTATAAAAVNKEKEEEEEEERWGVELVRPGAAAPLAGAERTAAVAAMAEYGEALEELGEEVEGLKASGAAGQLAGRTFGDALRSRFDQAVSKQPGGPPAAAAFAEGWACRERLQRAYDGFHTADVAGAEFIDEYEELEGPNVPVPGGYQHLAELLAAGLPIRLNSPVTSIRWGGSSSTTASESSSTTATLAAPVSVTLAGGEKIDADALVCTFSLGVLKAAVAAASDSGNPSVDRGQTSAAVTFDPPLPPEKVKAVRSMHIGLVNKLFVEFDFLGGTPPPEGTNPVANGRRVLVGAAAAAGAAGEQEGVGEEEGEEEDYTPQPPPLAYSRPPPRSTAAAAAAAVGSGAGAAAAAGAGGAQKDAADVLVGPRRRVQATGAQTADSGSAVAGGGSGSGSKEVVKLTSYCLLWPTEAALWSAAAANAAGGAAAVAASGVTSGVTSSVTSDELLPVSPAWGAPPEFPIWDPVYLGPAVEEEWAGGKLPGWLHGLHSWRWSDGPEWCKPPAHGTTTTVTLTSPTPLRTGFVPRADHWQDLFSHPWPGRDGYCAVLWVTGRAALALERLTDAQIASDIGRLLSAYPAVPLPPGAPRGAAAVRGVYRSNWCGDDAFRGSYSYPGPGATGDDIDTLAAPLLPGGSAAAGDNNSGGVGVGESTADGALLFAGEATSRAHTGTVHGAFLTGQREARRLLQLWGLGGGGEDGGETAA